MLLNHENAVWLFTTCRLAQQCSILFAPLTNCSCNSKLQVQTWQQINSELTPVNIWYYRNCHLLFTKRIQKAKTKISMNLYVSWWRGRQASQKSDRLGSSGKRNGILSLKTEIPVVLGMHNKLMRLCSLGHFLLFFFFFTAVCLGILCSGSSRQIVLQSSVPPAAIQFTSTLSFLYMTAGKQILPACRCALRIIKFGSIQHLICQAEFFSPLFFGVDTNL